MVTFVPGQIIQDTESLLRTIRLSNSKLKSGPQRDLWITKQLAYLLNPLFGWVNLIKREQK